MTYDAAQRSTLMRRSASQNSTSHTHAAPICPKEVLMAFIAILLTILASSVNALADSLHNSLKHPFVKRKTPRATHISTKRYQCGADLIDP